MIGPQGGQYVAQQEHHPTVLDVVTPWYALDYTYVMEAGASSLPKPPITLSSAAILWHVSRQVHGIVQKPCDLNGMAHYTKHNQMPWPGYLVASTGALAAGGKVVGANCGAYVVPDSHSCAAWVGGQVKQCRLNQCFVASESCPAKRLERPLKNMFNIVLRRLGKVQLIVWLDGLPRLGVHFRRPFYCAP